MSYVPNTDQDRKKMLETLGFSSTEELFADVPEKVKLKKPLALPFPLSEPELLEELKEYSNKNTGREKLISFLGAGSYNHFIPSLVKHITSRSEFYTAYTPYQPEISQGVLQSIFEYQSLICRLTGMDVANASMYDGATALAEAASLAIHYSNRKEIVVSGAVHPHYLEVLRTYATGAGWEIKEIPFDNALTTQDPLGLVSEKTAAVILAQPNFFGSIENVSGLADKINAKGALLIVSVDPISLGLLSPPGAYGTDIVTGEGQALGSPVNFGGPGLGIFAVKQDLMRLIPGRLVGQTVDTDGKRGFVLTLQGREQHIRREKAFSNICSNEALLALAACVYLSAMGKQGLKRVAELCLQKASYLKKLLGHPVQSHTFKEFVVRLKKPAKEVNAALLKENIIGGLDLGRCYPELKDHLLICVTEVLAKKDLEKFAAKIRPFIS
jgi:glycine dehydrogenase subunit 1